MDDGNELGRFLRARRDQVDPTTVGLPAVGDRRVPGLRRDEVATLAGLSLDYYKRLEQGRERHPSEQVIDALVQALALDRHAADYLFRLAMPVPRASSLAGETTVGEALHGLLEHALRVPATVNGPSLDVLAANSAARALYEDFARVDNLARMIFLDPVARRFFGDWDKAARLVVSNLRAVSAPHRDDPAVVAIIDELTSCSGEFASLWQRHEVRPRSDEPKTLHHGRVGTVHLRYQTFAVAAAPGQYLSIYTAEPSTASAAALAALLPGDTLTAAEFFDARWVSDDHAGRP